MGAFVAAPSAPWTTTKETLRHSSAQMESGTQARMPAASRASTAARLRAVALPSHSPRARDPALPMVRTSPGEMMAE